MKEPSSQMTSLSVSELENLLSQKDQEIEKALANLKFQELFDLILQVPWEKRSKLILLSPYPEGLVRNLPPIELFFTLKATSLDEVAELLSFAKGRQLQFLLDFDAWYKDRLKPERALSWLILFFHAGEDTVYRFLEAVDLDLLLCIFQKFVKVYKRPDDVDLLEAYDWLPPYTLDDVYFIDFKDERVEYYFRRIIEIIREEWPELYFSLMEALIWEIPAEVEERALRFRTGRLADEGIPDYYTALEVYTYLHPKALKPIDPHLKALPEEEEKEILYLLPFEESKEDFLIFKVLSEIGLSKEYTRVKRELAWLATKVTLVDYPVIDGIDEVKRGLDKMWRGLNLGLEYLSEGNLDRAKYLIENYSLEEIFRVSRTALRELRKFALSLLSNKEFNSAILKYLDQPYEGYLKGVIAKNLNQVKLYNPSMMGTSEEYGEFTRVSELRMVRRYLEEIGYWAVLLERGLGPISDWVREILRASGNIDLNFFTWSSLILTSLAQYVHSCEFRFMAIPRSAWKEVLSKLLVTCEGKNYLREELRSQLFDSFKRLAQATYYVDEELLKSFLEFVIGKLENEFRYTDLDNPPEAKYQTLILIGS